LLLLLPLLLLLLLWVPPLLLHAAATAIAAAFPDMHAFRTALPICMLCEPAQVETLRKAATSKKSYNATQDS
jgi:hypothetical protein